MAFGTAGNDPQTALGEFFRQDLRVFGNLLAVGLKFRCKRFTERHGLGGNHVHQGTALHAREHRGIDLLFKFRTAENDAAARTSQALVRRGRHNVGVAEGARVDACGDKPGVVRHINHQKGADAMRNLGKALEINLEGISRSPGHDELGLGFLGKALDFIVVDLFVFSEAVGHAVEELAGEIKVHAVREVAAVGKTHAHEGVALIENRHKDRDIGLSARMRLHVYGHLNARGFAEEFLCAGNGNALDFVDELAAAVVTLAGIAFGVLVGELTALGRHHGRRSIVFACNHFDVLFLTLHFVFDVLPDFGVGDGGSFAVFKHGKFFLRVS